MIKMILFAIVVLFVLLYASNWDVKRMLRFMAVPVSDSCAGFEVHAAAFLIDIFVIMCFLVDML